MHRLADSLLKGQAQAWPDRAEKHGFGSCLTASDSTAYLFSCFAILKKPSLKDQPIASLNPPLLGRDQGERS
jgi:hypothetical protein